MNMSVKDRRSGILKIRLWKRPAPLVPVWNTASFVDFKPVLALLSQKVWQMCRGRETRHQGSQRPTAA